MVITSILLRSLAGGLLVLLPLATSALVNLGLMGWTGIPLSMGTAAISAMAVGIGADYAVYFIFRVREEFQRMGDLRAGDRHRAHHLGQGHRLRGQRRGRRLPVPDPLRFQGPRPPGRAGGADHGDQQRRHRGLPAGRDLAGEPRFLQRQKSLAAPLASRAATVAE